MPDAAPHQPFTPADATVVVVTWNGAAMLSRCLDSVLGEGAAILVVDNASTDGTADLLASRYPSVGVVQSASNTGFAGGVFQALQRVRTPVTVLLNNDAQAQRGWLAALLRPLADPGVAAASGKLLLPDGRVNSAGGIVTTSGYGHDRGFGEPDDGRFDEPADVMYGCGAALALKTDAVREVGGVDPRFFLYYEDVDLSWRLRLAGYRIVYVPDAVVAHEHSASAGAGSLLHTYYTERNRLATLTVCATPGLVARAVLRYPLTTASVAAFESRRKAVRRVRAYLSYLAWLPALLRRRRHVVKRVARHEVEKAFLQPEPTRRERRRSVS
jgi:GT2 family glycosyltransferase